MTINSDLMSPSFWTELPGTLEDLHLNCSHFGFLPVSEADKRILPNLQILRLLLIPSFTQELEDHHLANLPSFLEELTLRLISTKFTRRLLHIMPKSLRLQLFVPPAMDGTVATVPQPRQDQTTFSAEVGLYDAEDGAQRSPQYFFDLSAYAASLPPLLHVTGNLGTPPILHEVMIHVRLPQIAAQCRNVRFDYDSHVFNRSAAPDQSSSKCALS